MNSAYGNNRQPAVTRSLEHRFIFTVHKRKLIVRTPPISPPPVGPAMTNGRHASVPNFDSSTDQEILTSERTLQFVTLLTTIRRRSLSCYK